MRFPVVLFDLDGTLIDSGPIIMASMRHASLTVLGRELDEERARAAIGGPGLMEQMRDLDPDRVDELVDAYRAHNAPLHDQLDPFPEALAALSTLAGEGRRLGVVTAKRVDTARLAFHRFPVLEETIELLVGWEDTSRHKPHPDPILVALERLGVEAEAAAYVGDSPFDVGAAKAAGVYAIAVGWGGIHSEETLLAMEPDALVGDAEELLGIL